jgi:FMN reductase
MFYPEATASDDDRDDNITKIRDVLNWTDAFVLGSPNYHGSISGVLKNFSDYYFNEFVGKTFGYLCTSL